MSIASLCTTTATVENPTRANVTGGYTATFAVDATVLCRIQPMSAAEAVRWGKDADTVLATMYLPTAAAGDITNASEIVVGSTRYEVLGLRDTDLQSRLTVVALMEQRS
ncbi:MAG TPA: head-tail adaptor protein [Phycisphaerae bacterium]|nr:head-tail adaptor protein [Phycisphaerae bacterium]